jgi:hypothetical protein
MKKPETNKNKKNTENTNQKKVTNAYRNPKKSITSAHFQKLKKMFEPTSNQSGPKKKFAMNRFKFERLKKVFEVSEILSTKGKDLPLVQQAKLTEKKPAQPQKFVFPEIEQKNPQEPLDLGIMRARTPTLMPVNMLSSLPYSEYSQAEYSQKPFYNISAYAFNSYSGTEKGYNEDRTKVILNHPVNSMVNNKKISPRVSYFGIFDGHGGDACSNFLKDKLDSFIFNSKYFPAYPIQAIKDAFAVAENTFMREAIDKDSNVVDKSGSCACVILIINDTLYAVNLGDSRALLSSNSGKTLRQITRDHKPDDPIEKKRIEDAGAQVFYANTIIVDGVPEVLNESDFGEGFKFPYRISPGGMAVSFII